MRAGVAAVALFLAGILCLERAPRAQLTTVGVGSFGVAAANLTLTAQWDASNAGSVTASSNQVSQWNDVSGSGFHLTQATGANKPLYPGATQNSLNTMDFGDAATVQFLDRSSMAIAQPFLVCVALKVLQTFGGLLFDDVNGTSRVTQSSHDGAGGHGTIYAGTANIFTTTVIQGNWFALCSIVNGASSTIYVNGAQEGTGNIGANNFSSLRLGARFDGTTLPFYGLLGEMRIYSGATPAGSNVTSVTNALRTKWGF